MNFNFYNIVQIFTLILAIDGVTNYSVASATISSFYFFL